VLEPVIAPGAVGSGLTVIFIVRAIDVPQALVAVTFRIPDVAVFEKLIETLLPVPLIVAPVPTV
jgi:hypothetical protein